MHEFPPVVDDFSFGTTSLLLLVVLVANIWLSRQIDESIRNGLTWAAIAILFTLLASAQANRSGSTTYAVPWLNVSLQAGIAMVAGIAAFRIALKLKTTHKLAFALSAVSFVLPTVFVCVEVSMQGRGHAVAAARTQCRRNLRQLSSGMYRHYEIHERFPMPVTGSPPTSWRVHLLPFIDWKDIYEQYDLESDWNSTQNESLLRQKVSVYDCPERRRSTNGRSQFLTAYVVPRGAGTMFPPGRATSVTDIADGITNTLMIAEACGMQIVWAEPRDADIASVAMSVNAPGKQPGRSKSLLSSYHMGGSMMAYADGSVRYVSSETSSDVLRSLLTIGGNDTIEEVGR